MLKTKKRNMPIIGVAPTHRAIFDKSAALYQKNDIISKLKEMGLRMETLEGVCADGLLDSVQTAKKAADHFIQKGVDALFVPFCDFGEEGAVATLAAVLNKPVLIWAPRDGAPDATGLRERDSQCGVFSATKVLSRMGTPFSYITNSIMGDAVFQKGFDTFLRASAVAKVFSGMRVGQIAPRPAPFWCVMCNEGELLERFHIQIVPITLTELESRVEAAKAGQTALLRETVDDITKKTNVNISEEALLQNAALKIAIASWAQEKNLSCAAIQCWSALNDLLGLAPCFANGELTGEGFPVACETDIHGAITTCIAQAANLWREPAFLADLTIRHPRRDDAELLWHCGNFANALAAPDAKNCLREQHGNQFPGAGDWEIRGGDITVCRFDGIKGEYALLMGEGEGVPGPYNRGTYVYVKFKDWPLWEHRFVYGPYIHHCAGVHGRLAAALYEACRYIPGLKPDPVEPAKEEIERYLRT